MAAPWQIALGCSGVVDLIERNCAHARRMAERLAAGSRVTIINGSADAILRCLEAVDHAG